MTRTPPCCSLAPDELAERLQAWRRLDGARTEAAATATGAVLRYRLEPAVARALVALIEAEARCCPSLSFEAAITVHVEAPSGLRSSVVASFVGHGRERDAPPDARPVGPDPAVVREAVRAHYAAAAGSAPSGARAGPPPAGIGAGVYGAGGHGMAEEVLASSIGCADPTAVAELAVGETVLDLGSGAGLDVLLSARRVGPTGGPTGLGMTDEVLKRARRNQGRPGSPTPRPTPTGGRMSGAGSPAWPGASPGRSTAGRWRRPASSGSRSRRATPWARASPR